jgi:hypothetical protein
MIWQQTQTKGTRCFPTVAFDEKILILAENDKTNQLESTEYFSVDDNGHDGIKKFERE